MATIAVWNTVVVTISVFYEPNKYSCHAERDAIIKVSNKHILKECKIYIGRIKCGKLENASPCKMCADLLKKYGVKKVYLIWFFL